MVDKKNSKKVERKKKEVKEKVGKKYEIQVTAKDMLEAGCHFGHSVAKTHPRILPYLYGARRGVQVFDLIQTRELLQKAAEFLYEQTKMGRKIAWVGTKRQAREILKKEAERLEMPYVVNRWLGGTITNWEQIQKNVRRHKELKQEIEEGKYRKYNKKEQAALGRELARLERLVGGLHSLEKDLFDILVVVDLRQDQTAILEAVMGKIPTVAICDSNSDPEPISFPVPANDDSAKSVKLILTELLRAVEEGQKASGKQLSKAKKED